jgi:hypothetical protein
MCVIHVCARAYVFIWPSDVTAVNTPTHTHSSSSGTPRITCLMDPQSTCVCCNDAMVGACANLRSQNTTHSYASARHALLDFVLGWSMPSLCYA